MANAKPSRPGVDPTAGKVEINIPREETVVRKLDGSVVRRTEFQTGTIRETNVFPGDLEETVEVNENVQDEKIDVAAKLAEIIDADDKPKSKPKGKAKGKGEK